jgi:hypothetical protein
VGQHGVDQQRGLQERGGGRGGRQGGAGWWVGHLI